MCARESTLAERCLVVDISTGSWTQEPYAAPKGNRTKYLCSVQAGYSSPLPRRTVGDWLWKRSLPRYPLEFWSEVLAYHIGAVMGVRVPVTFAAANRDGYGALSVVFIDREKGEELVHGGDLLLGIDANYDRQRGRRHSVQLIRQALGSEVPRLYPELFGQFILDGVIGNSDRHHDNWGIIKGPHRYDVSPAFDNGSSLGRELTDTRVEDMLTNSGHLESYIDRGKSHVRWAAGSGAIDVTHEDLLRRHLDLWPELRPIVGRLLGFKLRMMERAIRRVCLLSRSCQGVEISEVREEFLVRLVLRRRERLRMVVRYG